MVMDVMQRAMQIAVEQHAGFNTATEFYQWLIENFTLPELEARSIRDLWFRWRELEIGK